MGPFRGSIEFAERPATAKIITIRKFIKKEPRAEEKPAPAPVPSITRSHLANRFLANWMAQNPSNNAMAVDDSLTDLKWLLNLDVKKLTVPTQLNKKTLVDPNTILNIRDNVSEQDAALTSELTPPSTPPMYSSETDYSSDPTVKPPYSYAQLIYMAMKETNKTKIVLSSIYNWITENFMYYRIADPSWQNSIRHTLSLNKCFEKVARRRDEPGKGGYWRINPEYSHMLDNANLKRRTCGKTVYPTSKRIRMDDENSTNVIKIADSDSNSLPYGMKDSDSDDSVLTGVSWSSIMNQDIEVGGVRIKTENLLDGSDDDTAGFLPMSPPSSEIDDMGLNEFFADFSAGLSKSDYLGLSSEDPINLTTSSEDPLNLTVNADSVTSSWFDESSNDSSNKEKDSGLHTPRSQSPVLFNNSANLEEPDFPWLSDIAAAFDIDDFVN